MGQGSARVLGQFAATASTFYNNKRGRERLRSWGSASAETRVIFVQQKVCRILLPPFCFLLRFQIQGGLSHLSVTDRGESLLGFGNDVPFSSWGDKLSATAQVGWGGAAFRFQPRQHAAAFCKFEKKNSCTVILWKHFRGRNFASFISADPPPPGPPAAKAPLPPGGAVV